MERIGIVGTGLVGGSLVRALRNEYDLVLWDRDEQTRNILQKEGFVILEPELFADQTDCVLLATPPSETAAVAERLLQAGAPVVFGTASAQEKIFSDLNDSRYLGLHPLAGSTKHGWVASRKKLLERVPWALVATKPEREHFFLAMEIVDFLQGSALAIDPAEHDRVLAFTSHSLQILELALAALLADQPAYYHRLSDKSLQDITQLAESSPGLWEETIEANKENISSVLEKLESEIRTARENLQQPRILWRHGQYGRESLLRYRWSEEQWRTRSLPWAHWWEGLIDLGQRGALVREPKDGGPLLYISASV